MHQGVFVAKATYAAGAWYNIAADKDIKIIEREKAQRSMLIDVTRVYRIVSTDALPVIAGVLRIQIALEERLARSSVRTGLKTKFENLMIEEEQGCMNIKLV